MPGRDPPRPKRISRAPGLFSDRVELGDVAASALIGVSGGRDSVALLHALVQRGSRALTVCHLDHGLRPESAEDARFVSELAAQWQLAFVSVRVDVAAEAKQRRQSLETVARDARYAFFATIARERRISRLFVAHHADDQVETLLFNLFRGAGSAGMGGMRGVAVKTLNGVALEIVRPLLGVWREEIDRYVARHGLAFREDESNLDPRHTRNRLRHTILPALEASFGRDIRRALWRSAEILQAEDDFLANLPAVGGARAEALAVGELRAHPLALQRRVIQAWLRGGGVMNVGFAEVEAVRGLTDGSRAKVNLPGDRHARRKEGRLFLE